MLVYFGDLLNGSADPVYQFYQFTMNFQHPASLTESTTVVWEARPRTLSSEEVTALMDAVLDQESYTVRGDTFSDLFMPYSLPLTLALPMSQAITEAKEFRRSARLLPSTTKDAFAWAMTFTNDANIPFLSSTEYYKLVIWSQSVDTNNWIRSFIGSTGGIIGIYFLILITIGMLIRRLVTGTADSLWIARMERPRSCTGWSSQLTSSGPQGNSRKKMKSSALSLIHSVREKLVSKSLHRMHRRKSLWRPASIIIA
jgi:hypothetical protein